MSFYSRANYEQRLKEWHDKEFGPAPEREERIECNVMNCGNRVSYHGQTCERCREAVDEWGRTWPGIPR